MVAVQCHLSGHPIESTDGLFCQGLSMCTVCTSWGAQEWLLGCWVMVNLSRWKDRKFSMHWWWWLECESFCQLWIIMYMAYTSAWAPPRLQLTFFRASSLHTPLDPHTRTTPVHLRGLQEHPSRWISMVTCSSATQSQETLHLHCKSNEHASHLTSHTSCWPPPTYSHDPHPTASRSPYYSISTSSETSTAQLDQPDSKGKGKSIEDSPLRSSKRWVGILSPHFHHLILCPDFVFLPSQPQHPPS